MDKLSTVVLGACVGDAVGAPLEFMKKRPVPKNLLKEAITMRGGGMLGLAPGQITDDGELTICLALSLQKNVDALEMYKQWLDSKPIDIGVTTEMALRHGKPSPSSEANGALMRCSAIPAFFYANKKKSEIAALARADARLTHSSEVCQDANAVYCVALAYLLKNESVENAIKKALTHSKTEKVREWVQGALQDTLDFTEETRDNMGWVRWSLQLAFYHLHKCSSFKDAIIDTVQRGGDTDTNAAIVGAIMAAKWGLKGIPEKWLCAVIACKVRPDWLRPAQFMLP